MTLEHPFADLVGFSVSERAEKQCVTELTLEKKHLNPNGVVHGGVLYTLAYTGIGGALMAALPERHYCVTIEDQNRLLPPGQGRLGPLRDRVGAPRAAHGKP